MKSKNENQSPADVYRNKLETALSHSDENGNACPYDVWPFAAAFDQLRKNPKSDETKSVWQPELARLSEDYISAKVKYKGSGLRDPRQQFLAAKSVLELKTEIDGGSGAAVMHAIAKCAAHGLVVPAWLAVEFTNRHQAVAYGDARDWCAEKSFGSPMRKGENVNSVRAKMQLAPWAYECAIRLLAENPKRAIDGGLFSEVAKEIGSSQTNVQKWIKSYTTSNEWRPTLKYFKAQLLEGRNADEAVQAWAAKREEEFLRAIGPTIIAGPTKKTRQKSQKVQKKLIAKSS